MKANRILSWGAAAMLATSAFGVAREWPIKMGELKPEGTPSSYPIAYALTMNQEQGSPEATSFTLDEDNGIRCVKAPCPSNVQTRFTVVHIQESKSNTIHYTAESNPSDPQNSRQLTVIDFEKHFMHPEQRWFVTVRESNGDRKSYGGKYHYVRSLHAQDALEIVKE